MTLNLDKTAARLAALGALLLIAGCAGPAGGIAGLFAAAVLGLSLLFPGCDDDDCRDYQVCIDGEVTTRELCCPEGDSCNYGLIDMCSDGTCRDPFSDGPCPGNDAGTDAGDGGSCATGAQMCPEECDGYVAQDCQDSVLVDVCCPMGVACNYGLGLMMCDDGSCSYDSCAPSCDEDAGPCTDAG